MSKSAMKVHLRAINPLLRSRWMLLVAALVGTTGCDSGPNTGEVNGVVTFNGKITPEGTISFYPVEGGRPASGKIQPDGTYTLSTLAPGDGAMAGDYKVTIEAKRFSTAAPGPTSLQEEIANANAGRATVEPTVTWLIPEKYSSAATSGITATVRRGANKIDFDLP